jgi:hypothetical protein
MRLAWIGVLGMAATASGGDEEKLRLREQRVELRVEGRLARATLAWSVANPTLRAGEGEVLVRFPKGAVVHEAELKYHIAPGERVSRLVPRARAASLYETVRKSVKDDEGMAEIGRLVALVPHVRLSGMAAPPPPPPLPTPAELARMAAEDPALVEQAGEDTYRLRFVPVPALGEQTVTLLAAWETEGALRVPEILRESFVSDAQSVRTTGFAVPGRAPWKESDVGTDRVVRFRVPEGAVAPVLPEGVSSTRSLLVIEQVEVRRADRALGRPSDEDLKRCGFVTPGASSCEERQVTTGDPARLNEAVARGLEVRRIDLKNAFGSSVAGRYDYVAHGARCPLKIADPKALRTWAEELR